MSILTKPKKFTGSSIGMMAAGLVLTTGAILGWKWGISPVLKRRKSKQAEEFADFIFEERKKKSIENLQQQ